MTEVKYDKSHHAGGTPEARIAARLKPSSSHATADHHVMQGSGPTRVHHTVHTYGQQATHGAGPLSHDEERE
jgi:hypothetical protein